MYSASGAHITKQEGARKRKDGERMEKGRGRGGGEKDEARQGEG